MLLSSSQITFIIYLITAGYTEWLVFLSTRLLGVAELRSRFLNPFSWVDPWDLRNASGKGLCGRLRARVTQASQHGEGIPIAVLMIAYWMPSLNKSGRAFSFLAERKSRVPTSEQAVQGTKVRVESQFVCGPRDWEGGAASSCPTSGRYSLSDAVPSLTPSCACCNWYLHKRIMAAKY